MRIFDYDGKQEEALGAGWLDTVSLASRPPGFWDSWLHGTGRDDQIEGDISADWIFGDAGRDLIFAAEGDDVIRGGLGADSLYGDEGRDEFVYASAAEVKGDVLKDFVSGEDRIVLSKVGDFSFIADRPMSHALWTKKEYRGSLRLLGDTDGNPATPEVDLVLEGPDIFMKDIASLMAVDVGVPASVKVQRIHTGPGMDSSGEIPGIDASFFVLAATVTAPWFGFLWPWTSKPLLLLSLDAGADSSAGAVLDVTRHAEVRDAAGTAAGDIIIGNGRSNHLSGRAGNDSLVGAAGDDILTGGAGADQFIYTFESFGNDVIVDFNRAEGDWIDFRMIPCLSWNPDGPQARSVWMEKGDDGVVLYADLDGNPATEEFSITLRGVFDLQQDALLF